MTCARCNHNGFYEIDYVLYCAKCCTREAFRARALQKRVKRDTTAVVLQPANGEPITECPK